MSSKKVCLRTNTFRAVLQKKVVVVVVVVQTKVLQRMEKTDTNITFSAKYSFFPIIELC